jgi:hypothetical protein
MLAEEQVFTHANLASGTGQAFPIVRLGGELASEQHLDAAVKKIAGSGILRADRLSPSPSTAAVKPGGKHACVVEHDQVAGPQQIRELAKLKIGPLAAGSRDAQHAGGIANGKGFLGNEFVGKMKMEVRNQHGLRL